MEEIWKDITVEYKGVLHDFTGLYEVSNMGRVRNSKTGRIMKLIKNKQGYLLVALSRNGKQKNFYIHRLVASAFIPNPNNLPYVNHKSEVKTENYVDNLEWCDAKYNNSFGTRTERVGDKLRGKQRLEFTGDNHPRAKKVMCIETGQVFGTLKEAQEWLGKGHIISCLKGKTKTAGGYHWEYVGD